MDNSWTWISSNNVIKKRVTSVGTGKIHPFDSSKCRVRFIDVSTDNGKPLVGCPEPGTEKEYVMGEGETLFDRTMEQLLLTMVLQEVAHCELKLANTMHIVKVELIQCEIPTKPPHRLSEEEKLASAEKLKMRASELIKANRYEDAVALLSRAFRFICWARGNDAKSGFSDLYFSVIANLSLCFLKQSNYERSIALCTRVLEHRPKHIKCLLRRATSLNEIQETERAKADCVSALAIEPQNKMAEQLLEKIRAHMAKQNVEYTAMAKKMLHLN